MSSFARRVVALAISAMTPLSLAYASASTVRPHPTLPGLAISALYSVRVDGIDVPTHRITVNPFSHYRDIAAEGAMASFDFAGAVTVEVTVHRPVSGIVVRPLSRGIVPSFVDGTVTFVLDRPGQFVLEFDGKQTLPLLLFANPPEEDVPQPGAPGVIYFGPGDHRAGQIRVRSGETLYLAPGALVRGAIVAEDAENVTIRGRGVLYGGDYPRGAFDDAKFVMLTRCRGASVEGIVLLDGFGWNMRVLASSDIEVRNVKIVGWRRNTDGINPVSSSRVRIRDNFILGQDDGISIKGNARYSPEVVDIEIVGNVFWQYFMRSIVVGGEMSMIERVADIVVRDNDILHSSYNPRHPRDAALSVWNVDSATITGVLFENIRVENCVRLVRIGVAVNRHSRDATRGRIEGIVFRDIVAHNGPAIVEITGMSPEHDVKDIRFENVVVGGRRIVDPTMIFVETNEFVTGVVFE